MLLIQGGAGSGKSLFCHMFAKKLLEEDNGMGWIPIFINLPSLKDPLTQVIEETLRNNRFSEEEIVKMQQVKLLLFLDGYDEIKKIQNIYYLSNLAKWNVKVIITCRT